MSSGAASKCPTCGKTVYFAERVSALGKDYHKLCFKCSHCKKALSAGNISEHEGKPYCKGCYGSLFTQAGYGFGNTLDSHAQPEEDKYHKVTGKADAGRCATCKTVLSADDRFCPECGTKTF